MRSQGSGEVRGTRRWPRVPIAVVVALCALSIAGGAYLALALATADLANWGAWARDFAKSPGADAFAALIAAVIAYRGISGQVTVARASLTHQQGAARTDSWWEMFEWASSRAVPSGKDDQPLPDAVTISTLQRLAEDAVTDVQKTACAGMIDVLTARVTAQETAHEASPTGTGATETQPDAIAALASYVASARGTSAASAVAEGLVYEHGLVSALASIDTPGIRIFRNPTSDTGADAIAEVDGRRVLIVAKVSRDAESIRLALRNTIPMLRRALDGNDPLLIVTPFPDALTADTEARFNATSVQWRSPADTPALVDALRKVVPQ